MKRLTILSLVALLILSGCASTASPLNEIARTGNLMLDLREDYALTRYQMQISIDRFPAEVGVALLDLEAEIATYIDEVQRKWNRDELSTLLAIDAIYHDGSRLYRRGVALITPYLDLLEPATRAQMKNLAASANQVSTTYHQLRVDLHNAAAQTQIAQQSIELMTRMLRLGLLTK